MPSPWTYDDASHRYRSTETGRYIGKTQLIELRDTFIDSQRSEMDRLSAQMASGDITVQRWTLDTWSTIRETYIDEYAAGRGGRHILTQQDYGSIGGMMSNQSTYFKRFAEQIKNGELSEAQVRMRSQMYIDSATQAFERGRSRAQGVPQLPAYPGDGQTQCGSNCKCHWDIRETEMTFDAYWTLGVAEHCPDCLENASRWNPYQIARPL